MTTKAEILTARFYEWEARGRGWQAFPFAVELEPEFHPFRGHFVPAPQIKDDSRHHTLVSGILSLLKRGGAPEYTDNSALVEVPPVAAYPYQCKDRHVAYGIVLPKGENVDVSDMEELFLMLSYTEHPVSFEVIGTHEAIQIQLTCTVTDEAHMCAQVCAYFPTAVMTKYDKGLDLLLDDTETCVVDFGLRDEFMRSMRVMDGKDQDPYIGLFASLEDLDKGECGVVQILFKGVTSPWAESVMRAVTDNKGGSFFENDPDMPKLAHEKVSSPLFAVAIRVVGQSNKRGRAQEITKGITKTLTRLTDSKSNGLQPLSEEGYSITDKIHDVFLRQSHRLGMLLNGRELAYVAHLPMEEVTTKKLERDSRKTKAAPESAEGHPFVLGTNVHHGHENIVSVPASLRLRHTHVIGATGTGKSTLLLSMIVQDMRQGNGLAVLDPHGDLIESILRYVPQERIKDVILIDPADGDYPVGFNILSAHSEIEKDILSSDLVAAFKRLSTSWGDQMNSVFANAILAFLESKEGGTLADLRRFLVEKPYRDTYLKTVKDTHIVYYWEHEYPLLKSSSLGSILTRLDTFLRPKLIRNMVAQKKGLDFEHILDSKKILLIKLSQGLIGAENSFLLGTFFVSKIYQAAMARQAKSKKERNDFFFYIDEFQHFSTPSMSHILSGARKYHLGLILAHQDMEQLKKFDTELASSVVVNAGTRICFRLGDTDAKRFASGFSHFDTEDLENLKIGEAVARIEQPNFDFNLATIPLPDVREDVAERKVMAVIASSRSMYGTPREAVEKGLEHVGRTQKEPVHEPASMPEKKDEAPRPQVKPIPFAPVEMPKKDVLNKKVETQHRYLQTLIKKMAESRGYKAMLEEATPDGKGRVDVSLERTGKRIACEVSVTTDDTWEIHNVEKCLAAGYDEVIVCSNDLKNLGRIRKQVEGTLDTDMQKKVFVFEMEEVIQYFDRQVIQESSTETKMKGYTVKIEFNTSSAEEMSKRKENVIKTISNSIKKKRKN